ncbi:hypothetical protein C5167_048757 [Papaver somniferum]|uniref:Uncharacterized protein n=1 Tax=Papaver somniferum TaxID=3469 RepID=A0A4Y7KMW0_PAPSO|nr:uncharacterized protein LOC113304456 isoform X1 [Papaver somniferum]RZC73279.1 hypothetical protein C5167_048757 [Papaver somniferum]
MKLIWCPETASKSYIDTVKSCENIQESSVAELISGMAGGWKPQFIVETWCHGGVISTSVGLSIASRHTDARHVCIVPDELSRSEYTEAMQTVFGVSSSSLPEIIVGEPEEVMNGLVGVDFMVVDCRRNDFYKTLKFAKLSQRGAVLICKNVNSRSTSGVFRWRNVLNGSSRVVRTAYLPMGKGVDIAHVAASTNSNSSIKSSASRWIRHIDHQSGEEYIIRR